MRNLFGVFGAVTFGVFLAVGSLAVGDEREISGRDYVKALQYISARDLSMSEVTNLLKADVLLSRKTQAVMRKMKEARVKISDANWNDVLKTVEQRSLTSMEILTSLEKVVENIPTNDRGLFIAFVQELTRDKKRLSAASAVVPADTEKSALEAFSMIFETLNQRTEFVLTHFESISKNQKALEPQLAKIGQFYLDASAIITAEVPKERVAEVQTKLKRSIRLSVVISEKELKEQLKLLKECCGQKIGQTSLVEAAVETILERANSRDRDSRKLFELK